MERQTATFENTKTVLCKWFTENAKCKWGDKCNFAHGKDELKPKRERDTNVNNKNTNPNAKQIVSLNRGPRKQSSLNDSDRKQSNNNKTDNNDRICKKVSSNSENLKTVDCRLWLAGTCKFGDKCKFLHDPKKYAMSAKPEMNYFIADGSVPTKIESKEVIIDKLKNFNSNNDYISFKSNPLDNSITFCLPTEESNKVKLFKGPNFNQELEEKLKIGEDFPVKKLQNVQVILVSKDKKVLLTQRPKDESMPLSWVFPGGGVDMNEAPEVACKRELMEEVGIDIDLDSLKPAMFMELYIGGSKNRGIWEPAYFMFYIGQLDENAEDVQFVLDKKEVCDLKWVDMDIMRKAAFDEFDEDEEEAWEWLSGVYPNDLGQGMADGVVYSLRE